VYKTQFLHFSAHFFSTWTLTPQQNSPPYPAGLVSVREMPVTVYWITRENNWHKQGLLCYRMREVKSILIHKASSSNGTFARFPIYWVVRWFWLQLAWLNALVNLHVIITSYSTLWGLMGGWTKISLTEAFLAAAIRLPLFCPF